MKKEIFKVQNVKCGGCANTLITKLADEFGKIEVNLEVMPREITVEINEEKIPALRKALHSLGYPMADETLGFVHNTTAQAKSFLSCTIGKFEAAKRD